MRTTGLLLVAMLVGVPAFAQSAGAIVPSPGVDLSGNWAPAVHEDQPERGPGPDLADFLGLPITDGARQFALSWDASRLTLPEHQCRVHVVSYIYRGPLNLRIWEEKDPQSQRLIAIKQYISTYEQWRTIWMDDRPHPPENAPHTFMGFSTGRWEGDILTVYTTHIKQGWIRRNGLPQSDKAVLTEHYIRHGSYLTHVAAINDPVYLTEPLIKTQTFRLQVQAGQNWLYPCDPVVEVDREADDVPSYLPGENPFLHEFADKYGIPLNAALGGAETMYPGTMGAAPIVPAQQSPSPVNRDLSVLPVQGNVYMISGAGGNIAVQVGSMGVAIVDTGNGTMSDKVLAAIRKLSDKPLQYVFNTHYDPDHTGGNEAIRKAGVTITGANVTGNISDARDGAQVIAHDNVLNRMSAPTGIQAPTPAGAWPTQTFLKGKKDLYFNDEAIEAIYQPGAATDGDSLVFFRHSDVLASGDVFLTTSYPLIDVEKGGTVQGTINALNRILEIAVPKHEEEGGTYIIPGHGRICDEFDVLEYRDMVVIIRDRVKAAINKGMTLEQIKAAHLTRDYDARYDAKSGLGSADKFIEAVYRSLNAGKK